MQPMFYTTKTYITARVGVRENAESLSPA